MTKLDIDIRALAQLARINISDSEVAKLSEQLPGILGMVDTVRQVISERQSVLPEHRNIMRNDDNPNVGGVYTRDLLDAAPAQNSGCIMVKQVINRAK